MSKSTLAERTIDITASIPDLKAKFWAIYWALPLVAVIPFAIVYWLWSSGRFYTIIIYLLWLLFTFLRYHWAFRKLKNDFNQGKAHVYSGKIVQAQLITKKKSGFPKKELLVTIGKDDKTIDFVLWQNRRVPFVKQDDSLPHRMQELTEGLLTMKVLPQSQYILSYEMEDINKQLIKNWGDAQLTMLSSRILMKNEAGKIYELAKDKADYIHFKRAANKAHFVLELSSDTECHLLEIPSFLPPFSELEEWMQTLPDFDNDRYLAKKEDTSETERTLVWERVYKTGVPHTSVYAGMKFIRTSGELSAICNNGHNEQIAEKDIALITVKSYSGTHPEADYEVALLGFGVSSLTVRSRAEHFDALLQFLYGLPDFDRENFHLLLPSLTESPRVVWIAKPKVNASITHGVEITTGYLPLLAKGLDIENKGKIIYWSDFQSLEQRGIATVQSILSPNPDYHSYVYEIHKPVILQGLHLEKLAFSSPAISWDEKLNKSWPIENMSANLSFGLEGIANYEKLKQHLTKVFGQEPQLNESETHLEAYWLHGRLKIFIQTWQPYLVDIFFNACSLRLEYEPDVSHFFEDDYVKHFQINGSIAFKLFKAPIQIKADYKANRFVRNTPLAFSDKLIGEDQMVIWLDHEQELIGIGNKTHAHIQPLMNYISWLFVGNFWRGEPRELSLYFNRDKSVRKTGPDNSIGDFALREEKLWHALLDAIIEFVPFECHYVEDRQYY